MLEMLKRNTGIEDLTLVGGSDSAFRIGHEDGTCTMDDEVCTGTKPNEEGIIKTSYSDENVGGASVASSDTYKNKVEFHLKRLDDQLLGHRRSSVSLIKLDVEGHEYEVLSGAAMILRESSPLILFEINKGEIANGSTKAKDFLHANDYTYFYYFKDVSPFADTFPRLAKMINALSVLVLGKKLRGKLVLHRTKGKIKNKSYPLMLASKDELPFEPVNP